ncbi:MAG TPA: anthranilate phosphoribosyltransferase [Gemmatimonadota bacterium]|jgi:anthranilate phosphoribosyltransferase
MNHVPVSIPDALRIVSEGRDLDEAEAEAVFDAIMSGRATPLLVAALLAALKTKGESATEIAGAARAMRRAGRRLAADPARLIDTCGTGGDGAGTFNISTTAAVVAAAAGARVAKHGNRAASSRCGSADVLEELGVAIELEPDAALACLERVGITFLFAPRYHPAMRHAVEARRELRLRTLFNYLGPLTNPAGARRQVIGVADSVTFDRLTTVLGRLDYDHCVLVHGREGLDEVSLAGPTRVAEWKEGRLREYDVGPADFGLAPRPLSALSGGEAAENARAVRAVLSGQGLAGAEERDHGPDLSAAADVVALNAGCALYVAGLSAGWREGVERARAVLAAGGGARKLDEWIRVSRALERTGPQGAAEDASGEDHSLHGTYERSR